MLVIYFLFVVNSVLFTTSSLVTVCYLSLVLNRRLRDDKAIKRMMGTLKPTHRTSETGSQKNRQFYSVHIYITFVCIVRRSVHSVSYLGVQKREC